MWIVKCCICRNFLSSKQIFVSDISIPILILFYFCLQNKNLIYDAIFVRIYCKAAREIFGEMVMED